MLGRQRNRLAEAERVGLHQARLGGPALFVLLWSTGFVGAKYGLPYAPPFWFLTVRLAVAALLWFGVLGCALLGGVYFAFSAFIMRALREAGHPGTVAMNAINRVILRSTFMPLFFGTTLAGAALVVLGLTDLHAPGAAAMLAGGIACVLGMFGVTEFTFKHTYVAYEGSLFRGSDEDEWARQHRVEFDPFGDEGEVVAALPWGPRVRRIRGVQACYYHEPTPGWELDNQLCRSSNLLSDGAAYASLEDTSSLLFRLRRS